MADGGQFDLSNDALVAANICAQTRLATDFLNHFNEPAMLIDMLSVMPEAAEDVLEWEPRSYVEHFEHSGFRDKAMAVAAYQSADPEIIARFETACERANADLLFVQSLIRSDDLAAAADYSGIIYQHISDVNDIIVGSQETLTGILETNNQGEIDALFD